jgi:threonine synthase
MPGGIVKYVSTRGDVSPRSFSEILLEGLAPDGGLYLPTQIPSVDAKMLAGWRPLAYADLAFEVLSLFVDDVPSGELRRIVAGTYTEAVFGSAAITPLTPLEPGVFLQQLSNGPTLAFKDMAMQLLGGLFEYELGRRGQTLNILGATSGDTGSAAEHAMRGRHGVKVFMLSPHDRMSPFQQAQMFSITDPGIHNLAVEGVFDDCQDIVKAVSHDLEFKRRWHIGTVNSINWARLLAQVVYYVNGYLRATDAANASAGDSTRGGHGAGEVSFAVPSGNFGNICAGHIARMMGVPIRRLVLATNENDVLDEFFRTGTYRVRSSAQTQATSSPSMDIGKASNLERFVYELVGRHGARTRELFGADLTSCGAFTLRPEEFARVDAYGFVSGSSTHADRVATIRATARAGGRVVDPHTADGLTVGREHVEPGVPMIVLETALPAKFSATIVEALGREPSRPAALHGLEELPMRCTVVPPAVQVVKDYIITNG